MKRHRQHLIDVSLLVGLTLLSVSIIGLYVAGEHNFYWWVDWWSRTIYLADLFRTVPSEALRQIQSSLAWERNSLFTIPLIPFVLVFGPSRLVYEVGLVLVYLLPFCLSMGAIASQLILGPPRLIFWSTAFLTLLLPVNWTPTFLGIPDTGAALFIALATLVYLQDISLKQAWRIPVLGLLIASAVLIRRHFSYGGLALLGAMSIQALWLAVGTTPRNPSAAWKFLLQTGVRLCLIGATILGVMRLVAWEFTWQVITKDYKSLYASWSLPLGDMVQRYGSFYGWATWALILLGWVAGYRSKTLVVPKAIPFCICGGLSLLIWLVGLRYGNVFYALHITPIAIIGLAVLGWSVSLQISGKRRTLLLSGIACYLVSNCAIALTSWGGAIPQPIRPLFAASMAPLVRSDYNEVIRLVDFLRQLTPNRQPIYVAGHQRLQLNTSLIRAVEQVRYRQQARKLNLLTAPQIDSQDFYPLQPLLQAEYVVIPQPLLDYPGDPSQVPVLGEWVLPQETDVVKVVLNAFTQNGAIAQDFEQLPIQFQFDYKTTVRIYRRTRPTTLTSTVRSLHAMQQQIGQRPGGQLDWISLSRDGLKNQVNHNQNKTYRLVSFPGDVIQRWLTTPTAPTTPPFLPFDAHAQDNSALFLYADTLTGPFQVTGWLKLWTPPCRGAMLQWVVLDAQGSILQTADPVKPGAGMTQFTRSLNLSSPSYLLLKVVSESDAIASDVSYCTVDVNQLVVSPISPQSSLKK